MAWKAHVGTPEAKSPNMNARNPVRRLSKSSEKKPTMAVIAQIEKKRDQRRRAAAEIIEERKRENEQNEKMGRPGDVDFQRMIKQFRANNEHKKHPYTRTAQTQITICVRKRPVNSKETKKKDYDSVTCLNPSVIVHECKLRVDGITKYLDNNEFVFDNSFDEFSQTEEIYQSSVQHLIPFIFDEKGCATVFAYGQTGSGKTYTMEGIQRQATVDLFNYVSYYESKGTKMNVCVSFFELYAGRCQDLLSQERLTIREDGKGEVQIIGLEERQAQNSQELLHIIDTGNRKRTTRKTEVNDQSSRSHGICQINIRESDTNALHGKLSLIDLAGSERGADTKNHNRQRRMESSEINKSLLALKECIRALDTNAPGVHIPFRASQLTQVLKDSFTNSRARTVMIAAISPCASSADHTVNTLRYADRVKEKPSMIEDSTRYEKEPRVNDSFNCAIDAHPVRDHHGSLDMTDDLPPAPINAMVQPPPLPTAVVHAMHLSPIENDKERENQGCREDIKALHYSLRRHSGENFDEEAAQSLEQFHEVVQGVYEAQEELLSCHHECIKENAELLTEETALFTAIQGDDVMDYDIDQYVKRLDEIVDQKSNLVSRLRRQLEKFRQKCEEEETASKKVGSVSFY